MSVPLAIAIALGVGVASLLSRRAVRALRHSVGRLRAFRRARSDGFSSLPLGPTALRGSIVPIDLVRSSVSGAEGVYVCTTCERWDDQPNTTGVGGKWVVADRDERAAPFELSGRDGERVLVDPAGAEVWVATSDGPSDDPNLRYQEGLLAPGAEVVVIGEARHEGGFEASATYRGHTMRTVVGRAQRDGLLVATAARLGPRLAARAALHGLCVLPALGLGAFGALYVLGNAPSATVACPAAPVQVAGARPAAYRALPWAGPAVAGSRDVARVGVLTLRLRALGVMSPAVRGSVDERVRRALWRRKLSWLAGVSVTRRRRYLVVDEIVVRGVAVRDRAFWRSYCARHPKSCAR